MSAEAVPVEAVEAPKVYYTLVPLADRILVRRDPDREMLSETAKIYAADINKERQTSGEVIAIGQDVKGINVGDSVAFSVFAGIGLPEDKFGKDMLVMAVGEAIGIIRLG